MRFSFTSVALFAFVGVTLFADRCAAAPLLDQSHVLSQSVGGLITVSDFTPAQTFTVGQSGLLSQLDIAIRRESNALGGLQLELWPTEGGLPSGLAPLYTAMITNAQIPAVPNTTGVPFTSVDVSDWDFNVQSGDQFAIALRREASFDDPVISWGWGRPGYAGGSPASTAFGRPWEFTASEDTDFAFQTWVDLPAPTAGPPGPLYRLIETARAIPPANQVYNGILVGPNFYVGTNFEIDEPTHIREVGAQFVSGAPGQVFGAIVKLNSINGIPNPTDFSGSDVLGTTLLDLPTFGQGPTDVKAPLDLMLEPGYYGFWVGSGRFDASGSSSLYRENDPVGSSPTWSLTQSSGNVGFFDSQLRLFVDAASAPGTVQRRPTVDAGAVRVGSSYLLESNEVLPMQAWNNTSLGEDKRVLMEFDISDIPPQASIESVVLDVQVVGRQGGGGAVPRLHIHGYAGDGVVQPTDAESPLNLIGSSPPIDDLTTFSISLDPAYVQSLLGQTSHLGLMGLGDANGLRLSLRSLEGDGLDQSSFLTIAYTLAGDFDADLDVDGRDFLAWQRNPEIGELADWRANYGNSPVVSALSTPTNVPEPSGVSLLAGSMVLSTFCGRRS